MSIPLLLDVDTGVDDAVALLLAASRPDVEIVAVTCCAGNVEVEQAVANTLAVLELCGLRHVEVAAGPARPLVEPLRTATSHGPRGLGYADPPPARATASGRFAPDVLVEKARRRPSELLLVATGPLTNVALALRSEPALPQLLRRLVVMGGAFDHPGNTTPVAEFNVAVDPEAAHAVVAGFATAAERPLLVGLDVTDRARLRPEHVAAVGSGPVATFVEQALRVKFELNGGFVRLHDPLALALALDPSLGASRPAAVDVELTGSLTRAMTVVDWDGLWGRAANAEIAVEVDYERFAAEIVSRLADLDAAAAA